MYVIVDGIHTAVSFSFSPSRVVYYFILLSVIILLIFSVVLDDGFEFCTTNVKTVGKPIGSARYCCGACYCDITTKPIGFKTRLSRHERFNFDTPRTRFGFKTIRTQY